MLCLAVLRLFSGFDPSIFLHLLRGEELSRTDFFWAWIVLQIFWLISDKKKCVTKFVYTMSTFLLILVNILNIL